MDYEHFFNTYGYVPQDGWVGYKKQLNEQDMETDFHDEFGFGFKPGSAIPEPEPEPEPSTGNYLTFTHIGDGVGSICFINHWFSYDTESNYVEYRMNGTGDWIRYNMPEQGEEVRGEEIEVRDDEYVQLRGINHGFNAGESYISIKTGTSYQPFDASGDITSLLNGEGGDVPFKGNNTFSRFFENCEGLENAQNLNLPTTTLSYSCYSNMFSGCTSLRTAPELPATELANNCYSNMFSGCTSLRTAPELPATELANNCYYAMFNGCTSLVTAPAIHATRLGYQCCYQMFNGCTSLVTAPELPATTLVEGCYYEMFQDCIGLTSAPELPATTMAPSCYRAMFKGCTGLTSAPELPATELADECYYAMFQGTDLTTAPELPATTLADECYYAMFQDCTDLTTAPELPATTLADKCYSYMFSGCTGITSHDVETLNDSNGVFQDNSSCTSLTIHADPAPAIGVFTLNGLPDECVIYVPDMGIESYKEGEYWSERADYIQAMP